MSISAGTTAGARAVLGNIRTRLLVNATVDPDEAAARLPAGLRPYVSELGTVVGCCMLDITHLRPSGLPAAVGMRLHAVAHRISAEWQDPKGDTTVGVFVPMRFTDSLLARGAGGRWFPGVHRAASIDVRGAPGHLEWRVSDIGALGIKVSVTTNGRPELPEACEPIGGTCLSADVGLSPDRFGVLEGARMEPTSRVAEQACIDELESGFLSGFATAQLGPSYVMRDVTVRWTAAPARVDTSEWMPA